MACTQTCNALQKLELPGLQAERLSVIVQYTPAMHLLDRWLITTLRRIFRIFPFFRQRMRGSNEALAHHRRQCGSNPSQFQQIARKRFAGVHALCTDFMV